MRSGLDRTCPGCMRFRAPGSSSDGCQERDSRPTPSLPWHNCAVGNRAAASESVFDQTICGTSGRSGSGRPAGLRATLSGTRVVSRMLMARRCMRRPVVWRAPLNMHCPNQMRESQTRPVREFQQMDKPAGVARLDHPTWAARDVGRRRIVTRPASTRSVQARNRGGNPGVRTATCASALSPRIATGSA